MSIDITQLKPGGKQPLQPELRGLTQSEYDLNAGLNTAVDNAQADITSQEAAVAAQAAQVNTAAQGVSAAAAAFNSAPAQVATLTKNSGSSSQQQSYQDVSTAPATDNSTLYIGGAIALYFLLKGKILHGLI